jgi:hypothetical protein
MAEQKDEVLETLNEQPQTNQMDTLWDIDEPSFDQSFNLESNSGDLLGLDKEEEPKEELKELVEKEETKTALPDLNEGEEVETKKEETAEELPDLDAVIEDTPQPVAEEEVEAEETDDNEFGIFAKMLSEKEILDLDEDFEPTEEGLVGAFEGTVKARVQEEIDMFQKGLPEEGKALLAHIMNGGRVSDFKQVYDEVDVSRLDMKAKNAQVYVLSEYMKLRGDTPEEIQENLELYEANDVLGKHAMKAQQRLTDYQTKRKEDLARQQEEAVKAQEEKRKEVVDTINEKVENASDISGFPISRKDKKKLLEYMTIPTVKVGDDYVTQFQADEMKASNEVDDFVLRAYLRMTNFDLAKVKSKTVSKYSSSLKEKLQTRKSKTDTAASFGSNKKPRRISPSGDVWNI